MRLKTEIHFLIDPLFEVNPWRFLRSSQYRAALYSTKGRKAVLWALFYWACFLIAMSLVAIALIA